MKSTRIFISATSGDLKSVRKSLRNALLELGYHPIEATSFGADWRAIDEMLENKISECHAVIHIVGFHYGGEPELATLPKGKQRMSWTQMERDIAKRLGKKIFTFICTEHFDFEPTQVEETEEKKGLQREYRDMLIRGRKHYVFVNSRIELDRKVRSIQPDLLDLESDLRVKSRWIRFLLPLSITLLIAVLITIFQSQIFPPERGKTTQTSPGKIVIGGKNFLESSILLEVMATSIEEAAPGLEIERKHNLGETEYLLNRLRDGEIHIYAEYSGTILAQHLGLRYVKFREERIHDVGLINQLMTNSEKLKGLRLFPRFGFNNPYVIVMTESKAKELGLIPSETSPAEPKLTALARVSRIQKLSFRGEFEFAMRPDGFENLIKEYGIEAFNGSPILHGEKYEKLKSGEFDFTDGYATDPDLHDDKSLVKLEDDEKFFPSYHASPLARKDIIDNLPVVEDALKKLGGVIDVEEMVYLLRLVQDQQITVKSLGEKDIHKRQLKEIVSEFLSRKRSGKNEGEIEAKSP